MGTLCARSAEAIGTPFMAVGAQGLCWLAPTSCGKGFVLRWLHTEDKARHPTVIDVLCKGSLPSQLCAAAVCPRRASTHPYIQEGFLQDDWRTKARKSKKKIE